MTSPYTLSPQQLSVVQSDAGVQLVVAGPGSGKTLVIVARILFLINVLHVPASQIIVITFTNAAAHELALRLEQAGVVDLGYVGTLHVYCLRLLHEFGSKLGYRQHTSIVTETAKEEILQETKRKLGATKLSRAALERNNTPEANLVWADYRHLLKRSNMIDFDGILQAGLDLVQMCPDVSEAIGRRVKEMLVDESQDSATVDWCFYDAMPCRKFIVGDSDQSCFAFRGGRPDMILDWADDYPLATLETNYRSARAICGAATSLISYNHHRVEKPVLPAEGAPEGGIDFVSFPDDMAELMHLAPAATALNATGTDWKEIAVLTRTNKLADDARTLLRSCRLPVRFTAERERPEDWGFAIACLSLMVDPTNDYHAEQVLKGTGLHQLKINEWKLKALRDGTSLVTAALIPNVAPASLQDAVTSLVLLGVCDQSVQLIQERANMLPMSRPEVSDLLADLWSHEGWLAADESDGISVLTIHNAKGKEFDHVFVIGCEEGILPSAQSVKAANRAGEEDPQPIEEERRLMFVAITRARYTVTCSWAQERLLYGHQREKREPSRFLEEMK